MEQVLERNDAGHDARRRRRTLRVDQPSTTSALRRSQRRAAEGRTTLRQAQPVEDRLRWLGHLMPGGGG
jgi:hypothetical protein